MKILARCGSTNDGHKATRIAALLMSGLWDLVSPDDRRMFTEDGEVPDTPGGQMICEFLKQLYSRP